MFPLLTTAFVALAVFATSALSGVFGMAGGLVLLAILLAMLPVATAIAVQGAIQIVANGSRAWFSRAHIDWRVLGVISTGLAAAGLLLYILRYTPDLAAATAYWDYRSGVQYPVTGVYGATIPGPVWQRTMSRALAGKPVQQFQQPTRDFGDVKNKKVPNVVGRHVDDGASVLGRAGFQVKVKHVRSDAPPATIVRMSPSGSAPEGSVITLYMSSGHGGRPRR